MTKEIPEFIRTNPDKCRALIEKIKQTSSLVGLNTIFFDEVKPLFVYNGLMLKTINEHYNEPWLNLAQELKKLVGKEEADLLMTTIGNISEDLESMGIIDGVAKIANGKMTKEEYLHENGHRFPYEWHLDIPRPSENPSWLDEQINVFKKNPFDLDKITENQRKRYDEAWERFKTKYPSKAQKTKKKLDDFAKLSIDREHIRSEITRSVTVIREHYLRAGELTELGEDIFLLTYEELVEILKKNQESIQYLASRREMDRKLRGLPNYPSFISGAFNPFTWSKNPNRRIDFYDSHRSDYLDEDPSIITGNPGSGGLFEGTVRVINALDEGHLLQQGEILVTSTTNIGWTPLFPRAAAVVTDIGMPLAHAAIVAREIGIPAVVGCGTATKRLKTGDRVMVDGDQGVVKLL
jgi:pyruvate,water dikinase